MAWLFSEIIYRPLLNLTVLIYGSVGFTDLGLTIILMTVAVRASMLPLSLKTARSQKAMAELAPEIEQLKVKHKGDTAAQSEAVMKLYKDRGVSPLAGCLPLLVQIPLLLGLFKVVKGVFAPDALAALYAFTPNPGSISHTAFGFLDISAPSHVLTIAAGVLQFIQVRTAAANQPQTTQGAAMSKQMSLMLPVIIVVAGWGFPAGLALYWVVTTLFSLGEQLYLRRSRASRLQS